MEPDRWTRKPSPERALGLLREGNGRFVRGESRHPHTGSDRLRLAGSVDQADHAYATVIACSDSRVPVELIFDAGVMDLFVIRVAGNVCSTDAIGSIEYGVTHVHTPVVVLLGHTKCGAVTTVSGIVQGTGMKLEHNIPPILAPIYPAVEAARRRCPAARGEALAGAAAEENVWIGIERLFLQSPGTRRLVREGRIVVTGAMYDIYTGEVAWLPQERVGQILSVSERDPDRTTGEFAE
jgi:carbonic anhydrase